MSEFLKDLSKTNFTYYDNNNEETFNEHYRTLMNDSGSTYFDLDKDERPNDKYGKYGQTFQYYNTNGEIIVDDAFAKHNKKVLSGQREDFNMDNSVLYYEDRAFNEQFLKIYETNDGGISFLPESGDAVFYLDEDKQKNILIEVLPSVDIIKIVNGATELKKTQYSYINGTLTLKKSYLRGFSIGRVNLVITYDKDGVETDTTYIVKIKQTPVPTEITTEEDFKNALLDTTVTNIKLTNNITTTESVSIINGRDLDIDLNGKTFTYSAPDNLKIGGNNNTSKGTSGTLVISNGTFDLGSKALRVYANNDPLDRTTSINSKLVLGENLNITTTNGAPIGVMGKGAELFIDKNCGTIETTAPEAGLIVGNGSEQCADTKITINGGTFKVGNDSGSIVIYHPQAGELIINGGTFEGADGIQLKAGKASVANISNATIKATYDVAVDPNTITDTSSGSVVTGSAISLIGNIDYSGSISLVINDKVKLESVKNPALIQAVTNSSPNIEKVVINKGNFVGKGFDGNNKSILIKNYLTLQDKVDINGGTYNSDVSEYLKTDYECVKVSDETWRVKKK